MGILEYLLGPKDSDADDVQPDSLQGWRRSGRDQGRTKTKTEKDLRRVQSTHDPEVR